MSYLACSLQAANRNKKFTTNIDSNINGQGVILIGACTEWRRPTGKVGAASPMVVDQDFCVDHWQSEYPRQLSHLPVVRSSYALSSV